MDKLTFGLSVAAIGMLVVFFGLVILIGSIKLISFFSTDKKAKKAASVSDEQEFSALSEDSAMQEGLTPDVIAAITAAIATVWQGDTGFVVRRVRRVQNTPAWNRAGREDQVYSRL